MPPTAVRRLGWSRAVTGVDVLDQDGARLGAVRLPQLLAVGAVVGGEEQRPTHVGKPEGLLGRAARPGHGASEAAVLPAASWSVSARALVVYPADAATPAKVTAAAAAVAARVAPAPRARRRSSLAWETRARTTFFCAHRCRRLMTHELPGCGPAFGQARAAVCPLYRMQGLRRITNTKHRRPDLRVCVRRALVRSLAVGPHAGAVAAAEVGAPTAPAGVVEEDARAGVVAARPERSGTPPREVDDRLPGQPGEGVVDRARPTRTQTRVVGGDVQSLVARERGVEAAYVGGRGSIAPDRGHGEAVQRLTGLGRVRDVLGRHGAGRLEVELSQPGAQGLGRVDRVHLLFAVAAGQCREQVQPGRPVASAEPFHADSVTG